MFELTSEPSENLYFAIMSGTLGNVLEMQIESFKFQHADLKIIIIDTLQKIRSGDVTSYAFDYKELSILKNLADNLRIYFPSKGVRCIALSNGVDSGKGESEIAPFLNIPNETHTRQTGKKVKAAMKTRHMPDDEHVPTPAWLNYQKYGTFAHVFEGAFTTSRALYRSKTKKGSQAKGRTVYCGEYARADHFSGALGTNTSTYQ